MTTDPEDSLNSEPEPAAADATEAAAPGGAPGPGPTPPPLTPDELEALQTRAAQADHHWELHLRARADLDNYRKRAARERQDAVRFASLGLVERLIPVLDSFDSALVATASAPGSADALQQGVALVYGQLKAVLTGAGVQEINALGQPFDPNLHEAVAQVESAEVPEGHVLQQLRKGYRLHDRLVRPASVVVAHPPAVPGA